MIYKAVLWQPNVRILCHKSTVTHTLAPRRVVRSWSPRDIESCVPPPAHSGRASRLAASDIKSSRAPRAGSFLKAHGLTVARERMFTEGGGV